MQFALMFAPSWAKTKDSETNAAAALAPELPLQYDMIVRGSQIVVP
jgi:hypothetical protein